MPRARRAGRQSAAERRARVPVLVVTGYLGAGKTTFLNGVLKAHKAHATERIAVLVNELGDVDVDAETLGAGATPVAGGCVCCTQRGGLEKALVDVLETQDPHFVVVETSGASDPAPMLAALAAAPLLRNAVALDAVVCLLDAAAADDPAVRGSVSFQSQLACADVVLLTKCDVTEPDAQERTRAQAAKLAPHARVMRCDHGRVPLAALIGHAAAPRAQPAASQVPQRPHARDHLREDGLSSVVWRASAPVDRARLLAALRWLLRESDMRVLRAKGFVLVAEPDGETSCVAVQAVGARLRMSLAALRDDPSSHLVVIGAALQHDVVTTALAACEGRVDLADTDDDAAADDAHAHLAADARFAVDPVVPGEGGVRIRLTGHLGPLGTLPPPVVAAANDALAERVAINDGIYLSPSREGDALLLIPRTVPPGVDAIAAISRAAADVLMLMMDRAE